MYLTKTISNHEDRSLEVQLPDHPEIITSVPALPKTKRRIIIRHTPNHVFWWIDAICEGPQAEESPWQ